MDSHHLFTDFCTIQVSQAETLNSSHNCNPHYCALSNRFSFFISFLLAFLYTSILCSCLLLRPCFISLPSLCATNSTFTSLSLSPSFSLSLSLFLALSRSFSLSLSRSFSLSLASCLSLSHCYRFSLNLYYLNNWK